MTAVNVPLKRPMLPRDPHEPGRVATPLELLFDLVFVVAIASNSAQLHHAITEHHASAGILGYTMTWFAIWWAWVGFTWFASAYDNDDALYRLLAFVIMTGSLMLAASVPDLFADGQSLLAVAGYAVMRLGYVALWLRAAASDPVHRQAALRYAVGVTAVQSLWIARIWAPSSVLIPTFFLLVICELSIPVWAEGRHGTTPWHRHHIAERFSLMTIIVLGEVFLSSVTAVQGVDQVGWDVVPLALGGLLLVFGLWWVYFKREHHRLTDGGARTWMFSYGHLVIFASIASLGAGLAAVVDAVHGEGDGVTAVWVMAIGLSLVGLTLSGMHAVVDGLRGMAPAVFVAVGAVGVAVATTLGLPLTWAVLGLGLVLTATVTHHVLRSGH